MKFTLDLDQLRLSAMLAADIQRLDRILDDRLTYTHSTGAVDDKRSYLRKISSGDLRYRSIKSTNKKVIDAGACALIFDDLVMEVDVQNRPYTVISNALSVWVASSDESWKLLAVQSARY